MWKQYRRMFWYTQAGIVAICIVLVVALKVPVLALWAFVAMMELGSVAGAWWSNRLKNKINAYFDHKEYNLPRR